MPSLPTVFVATVFVVIGLLGNGGCAFLRGSAAGTAFVDPGQRHLLLPGLTGADPAAVAYRSPFEYQEYARSQTDGRAEALFMRTKSLGTALDMQPRQLESFTRRWAFNGSAQKLDWLQPRQSRVAGTDIRYRRYRLVTGKPSTTHACVAFMRTWVRDSLDPLLRPGRGYFGYHCAAPGGALSDATAQRYLRRIAIGDLPLLVFISAKPCHATPAPEKSLTRTPTRTGASRRFPSSAHATTRSAPAPTAAIKTYQR